MHIYRRIQLHPQDLLGMGSALLSIALFIADTLYKSLYVSSVGLHDLNGFSHRELILLLDSEPAAFGLLYRSQIGVIFYIGIAVVNLRICSRLSKIKPVVNSL